MSKTAANLAIEREAITGLILAGGRGSRMGNADKGLQPFKAQPMAWHVLQKLQPQVGTVIINANRNLAQYATFGVPVIADQLTGFAGPLAGLQVGLSHCKTPYLLTVACDNPFLPNDVAMQLANALLTQDADLAVAITLEKDADSGALRKQNQPVFCLLKQSLLPQLNSYLANGGRKMDGWFGAIKVAECIFSDSMAFRNINTLEQLHDFESADQRTLPSHTPR